MMKFDTERFPPLKGKGTMSDLLNQAADIMECHGWCANALFNTQGQMCVLGALSFAEHGQENAYGPPDNRFNLAIDIVRAANSIGNSIMQWSNRADGPTVIAGLRKAAIYVSCP